MNDFIGNNIRVIIEWGQLITGSFAIGCVFLIIWSFKRIGNRLLKWSLSTVLFLLILLSSLVFMRITYIKPNVLPILNQLTALIDHPAPALSYTVIEGLRPDRIESNHGKVVLVNFWATWCRPCIKEIPALEQLQKHYGNRDFKVIMISDEDQESIRKFVKKHDLEVEVVQGDFNWVNLGNERPASFILDKQGIVRHYFTGGYDFAHFEKYIKPLL